MKKLLLLAIFSLLILPANSQSKYEKQSNEIIELFDSIKSNFTETEEGIKIIKVVELPNIEKDKIYIAALEALSNIYKDSKEVIQNKDKEAVQVIFFSLQRIHRITIDILCSERVLCGLPLGYSLML